MRTHKTYADPQLDSKRIRKIKGLIEKLLLAMQGVSIVPNLLLDGLCRAYLHVLYQYLASDDLSRANLSQWHSDPKNTGREMMLLHWGTACTLFVDTHEQFPDMVTDLAHVVDESTDISMARRLLNRIS